MFFTSFVFRDNAFELINKLFNEENDSAGGAQKSQGEASN